MVCCYFTASEAEQPLITDETVNCAEIHQPSVHAMKLKPQEHDP